MFWIILSCAVPCLVSSFSAQLWRSYHMRFLRMSLSPASPGCPPIRTTAHGPGPMGPMGPGSMGPMGPTGPMGPSPMGPMGPSPMGPVHGPGPMGPGPWGPILVKKKKFSESARLVRKSFPHPVGVFYTQCRPHISHPGQFFKNGSKNTKFVKKSLFSYGWPMEWGIRLWYSQEVRW